MYKILIKKALGLGNLGLLCWYISHDIIKEKNLMKITHECFVNVSTKVNKSVILLEKYDCMKYHV